MKIRNFHSGFVLVRVFLEGVFFPYVKSININQSSGGAQCSIEVPPSMAINFEEMCGMSIHIFYANEKVVERFEDKHDNEEPQNGGWPLLFEGELAEFSEGNYIEGESLTLNFIGMGKAFEQTLLYFYDPSRQRDALNVPYQAMFIGNTSISLDVSGPISKTSAIYNAMGEAISSLEGSVDGRSIAYTAAISAILRDADLRHAAFSIPNNKYKLNQRFSSFPDPDVSKMISLRNLQAIVENHITSLPPETSIADIVRIIAEMIKYDWIYNPQPVLKSAIKFNPEEDIRSDFVEEIYEEIKGAVDSVLKTGRIYGEDLGNKPSNMVPPRTFENLIYQEYKKLVEQRNASLIAGNTAVTNTVNLLVNEDSATSDNRRLIAASVKEVVRQGYYPNVGGNIKNSQSDDNATIDELTSDDQVKQKNPESATELEQDYLRNRDELHQFMMTPMLMFTQPPKCNVFFPSHFSQYGISVPLKRRITRLMAVCQPMPSVNGGQQVMEVYIAPQQQSFHKLNGDKLEKYTAQYINYLDFVTGESKR